MYSSYGTLFGIPPETLTEEQWRAMELEKVFEFADNDIARKIIVENIQNAQKDDWRMLYKIKTCASQYLEIKAEYNKYLQKYPQDTYCRKDYVIWDLLDDENRRAELERLLDNKNSVAVIDFDDIMKNYPELCDGAIEYIMSRKYSNQSQFIKMISVLPAEKVKPILTELEGMVNDYAMYVLSSPHAEKDQILRVLKRIYKRQYFPPINIKIDASLLSDLAPIMRLHTLEAIAWNHYGNMTKLVKNISEDDLRELLFPSMYRYAGRVERMIKRHKLFAGVKDE